MDTEPKKSGDTGSWSLVMAPHPTTRTRLFRVTESIEENGFARLVDESSGQPMHADLFVLDPESKQALRLQPGDRVSGTARGQRVDAPQILEAVPPPDALVASSAVLIRRLEGFGLQVDASVESVAASEWRRDRRQAREAYPLLANVLRPQLVLLVEGRQHPLDDLTLVPRLVKVTRRHLPDLEVLEERDDNGDLQRFRVRPEDLPIPVGDGGEWEDAQGSHAPLIKFINKQLTRSGARERWVNTGANWLFAEPALAQMLTDAGLTPR